VSQAPYKIVEERRATNHKNALDKTIRDRVETRLEKLADNPRPADAVALTARTGVWRVRTGDYRILYEIDDDERIITIVEIAHRSRAYR
jgi:mRNA interferase RelE/StbE